MPKKSAGILLYRKDHDDFRFFLIHPGGPFFANKDAGAWSIPKGELDEGEDPLAAACREFTEETGCVPHGPFLVLTPVRQKNGKQVSAWAAEGDCDPAALRSNTFALEWPPRSGRMREFPEADQAGWFTAEEARVKLNAAQTAFIDELLALPQFRPPY